MVTPAFTYAPCPSRQVQEPVDPERSFFYPLELDLDLERDLGDDDSFDVDEGTFVLPANVLSTSGSMLKHFMNFSKESLGLAPVCHLLKKPTELWGALTFVPVFA